jgi:hypothetical protein
MLARLKFDLDALANSMIDSLPDSLFQRDNTTFADIAMGGGQFMHPIQSKLRRFGHSDTNISARLFGCEGNVLRLNYAVNKHSLLGTYTVRDVLKEGMHMKFDVVVGNPPYQDSNATTTKLWHLFLEKANELTKDGGHIGYITPRAWLERPNSQLSSRIVKNILSVHQLVQVDITAEQHFNIGESPCSYIIHKVPKHSDTKFIFDDREEMIDYHGQKVPLCDLDHYKIAIFHKLQSQNLPKIGTLVYNDTGVTDSIEDMLKTGTMSEEKVKKNDVRVFWTASQIDNYWMPKRSIKSGKKVIINRSGYYYQDANPNKYIMLDLREQYGIGAGAYGITVESEAQGLNLMSLLTNKLYRWYIDHEKTAGFNTGITKLPLLDISKTWTDTEVFDLFGINQDERDVICGKYS